MKKLVSKLIKQGKRRLGEKGFTLIELLVVVGILGILAAVVVPNIGKFIGSGAVEAANTEAQNVQTAIVSTMVDNGWSDLDGTIGPGTDSTVTNGAATPLSPAAGKAPQDYLTGSLQATYTVANGEITDAAAEVGGKWADLDFDTTTKTWVEPS